MAIERNGNGLPFLSPESCWLVTPTGEWETDSGLGAEYARLYVREMRDTGRGPLLSWIVRDMMKRGAWTGIEAAFLSTVGRYAGADPPPPLCTLRGQRNGHNAHNGQAHGAVMQFEGCIAWPKTVGRQKRRRKKLPQDQNGWCFDAE